MYIPTYSRHILQCVMINTWLAVWICKNLPSTHKRHKIMMCISPRLNHNSRQYIYMLGVPSITGIIEDIKIFGMSLRATRLLSNYFICV